MCVKQLEVGDKTVHTHSFGQVVMEIKQFEDFWSGIPSHVLRHFHARPDLKPPFTPSETFPDNVSAIFRK